MFAAAAQGGLWRPADGSQTISAGLTCLSAELSPIAKAARVAPAGRVRVTRASWARCLSLAGLGLARRRRAGGRRAGWQVVLKERSEYELLHSHTHPLPISFL